MQISEALKKATKILYQKIESPRKESEKILLSTLKKDLTFLILNEDFKLTQEEIDIFFKKVARRASGEPLEYITNQVSFYSKIFFIDYGALIPRPETEILVDFAFQEILKLSPKNQIQILEIGIGSGAISISLAEKLKNANLDFKIIGIDISQNALKIAKKNIENFNYSSKIQILQSDLFQNLHSQFFDLIISNPPYISENLKGKLQKELEFEPEIALFSGNDGAELFRRLLKEFFNRPEKILICEMGFDQKKIIQDEVCKLANTDYQLIFYQDLANLDRGFILKKKINS